MKNYDILNKMMNIIEVSLKDEITDNNTRNNKMMLISKQIKLLLDKKNFDIYGYIVEDTISKNPELRHCILTNKYFNLFVNSLINTEEIKIEDILNLVSGFSNIIKEQDEKISELEIKK